MKENEKYVRTSTTAQPNGIEEQSRDLREFAITLEIEENRAKELFERTKKELRSN